MAYTVIGLFEQASDAQLALKQLVGNGIAREHINVLIGNQNQESPDAGPDQLEDFFRALLDDGQEAKKFAEVARRSAVVTVQVASRAAAEHAAEVLDGSGAMPADETTGPQGSPSDAVSKAAAQPQKRFRSRIVNRPEE